MIRILFIAAACILLATSPVFSQNDSTRYINGLPVSDDDTARNFLLHDVEPKDRLVEVAHKELPADLLKSLESEELYAGWKDTTVYYDANTKLYLVHVKKGESVKIFGLNEKGKPVTFSEATRARD